MMRQQGGLERSVVNWYANALSVLLVLGGVVLLLVMFRVGPILVVGSVGVALAVTFTALFVSLFFRSEAAYRWLS